MPKEASPPKEEHRSFTIRIPLSMYIELAELARADNVFINTKATQLLKLGMGKHIELDQAISRLIKDKVTEE